MTTPEMTEPNNDEVICPQCSAQFRAIPVNVQTLLLAAGFEPPFLAHPEPAEPAPAVVAWLEFDYVQGEAVAVRAMLHPSEPWHIPVVLASEIERLRGQLASAQEWLNAREFR